ncbi:MAG: rhodanese-like domain-containing protein [Prevotella sp.]|uniref:rhodanese-like domain-containing protein n=1 Tax=Prevotella sp. TaxID=59823 RepID=UPI002A343F22|nr:rhodanese-like domain-containing protein [Prevotella sp.]MDD7318534.1 rhodanese-like domain-containing protein [Prevotellaceae bacterium]MDY4020335.1 rhodanese-like domain-containing protein [Prevotella sp.]
MNKILKMLLAFLCFSGTACGQKNYTDLDVADFEQYIGQNKDSGVQVVDVRTAGEFAEGTVPGAVLIDLKDAGFAEKVEAALDKAKPVAVFCRSGRRSAAAAEILIGLGFKTVVNLNGGFLAWQEAGKAVAMPKSEGGN